MTVIFENAYSLPVDDYPLTHARIAHANNWLSGGTASASTTATGYIEEGPSNSLTYERWKPTTLPAAWEYDHGSSVTCDYCVIAAHKMGTSGNSLVVQYYDGSGWVSLCNNTAITTDEAIFVIFEPQAAQRWRIYISSGTASTVAVVKFGEAMQLPRPLYGGHTPIPFGRQAKVEPNTSHTGEVLGMTKTRTQVSTSYDWSNLPSAWVRSNWSDFQKAAETEPVVIAWRPLDFGDCVLGVISEAPQTDNSGPRDLMSGSFSIRGHAHD